MKNILFLIIFFTSTYSISAQSKTFDARLLSKFSQVELNEMQSNHPDKFNYWSFYVANAYQIVDLPQEKETAHEIKGVVKKQDFNLFNVFDLNYSPLAKDYKYYRIDGNNKLLVILSEEQIKEKFVKFNK